MSAANASAPAPSVEETARAHEPSMEEILASIRRIIADDDVLPGARRRVREISEIPDAQEEPAPVANPAQPVSQSAAPVPVIETREAAVNDVAPPSTSVDVAPEGGASPVAAIRSLRLDRPEPAIASETEEFDEAGDSGYGDAPPNADLEACGESDDGRPFGVADAGSQLMSSEAASSIAAHFQTLAASMIINDSGLLQKYAQEMMRPLLKQWLDDNLPVIVERLVRAEIERVARGGRR